MFNKTGKIIIACVLSCALFIGLCAVPMYAKTQNEDLTELMINLGIYDASDSMEFVNENITREEVAGILSVFFGITEKLQATATAFEDVPEYWASGHIMAMVNNGIMSGYDDGLFRPKSAVTVAQMIKILVNLTGYQVHAERAGGYPQGYIYIASDIDILNDINIENRDREITKGEFTVMLYNTFTVPLLEQVTVGEKNKFRSDEAVTLLSQKLDIYETEGFVTALPYVSLDYNAPAGEGKIKIDDAAFVYYGDAYSYLGSYVEVYYRQTEEDNLGEIIHISEDEGKSDYIIVSDEDIISVSSGLDSFSYLDDDDDEVKIELDKKLMLIYNSKRMTYFTEDYLKPLQGTVKFCNTDSDGEYEFAIVENEVNYIVDKVSDTDGIISITDKNRKTPLVIDTKDSDVTYRVFNREVKAYLSDIEEDMILSVSADAMDLVTNTVKKESTILNVTISEEMISGTLDEISDEDISVDGVRYVLAKECKGDELKAGESYTFYLNYRSEIVGYDIKPDDYLYGILHAGQTGKGLSEEVTLKIFGEEGKLFTAKCSKNLRIDGYPEKSYKNVLDWLKTSSAQFSTETGITVAENGIWQLVRYVLDASGEITSLDTILANRDVTDNDLKFFESYISNTYLAWNKGSGTLGGRYGVTDDIVIFEVGTDRTTEDEYYILPLANYISSPTPTYFFDANEMNVTSAAIRVLTDPSANIQEMEFDSLMLFEKFKTKVGESGDISAHICGYMLRDNEYAEIELADDSVMSLASVKPGDFVRWAKNTNGKPSKIEKSMSIDGTGIKTNGSKPEGAFNTKTRLSYGKAMALDNEYIKVKYEGNKPYEEPCLYSRVKGVYIFDSATEKYYVSSMDNIRTAARYGESEADTIGMYSAEGVLWTVVIYR